MVEIAKNGKPIYQVTPSPTSSAPTPPASVGNRHDLWHGFNAYCELLRQAKRRVAEWFNEGLDRGQALVLAGPPGCGKTHLALVVLAAYGAPHQAFMISEPDLLANIKATYDGDGSEKMIMATYRRALLLILDDVGVGYVTAESQDWLEDIYWRLFDRRAELHLPTLITTNLNAQQLAARLGGRGYSRLMGMLQDECNYVNLFGVPDFRMRRRAE